MSAAGFQKFFNEAMQVIDGALLIVRTVILRMVARRVFGKRMYPTFALLFLGFVAYLMLFEKSGGRTFLWGLPFMIVSVSFVGIAVLFVEVVWYVGRLRTGALTLQLPRLEQAMALAVVASISSVALVHQALAPPPIRSSLLPVALLPCVMFTSLTVLYVATRRAHQLIALILTVSVVIVSEQWSAESEAWFRSLRTFRYFTPWNAWLLPVCMGLWAFVVSFSARGLVYGAAVAGGVTVLERTTGVSFLSLCYESSVLTSLVLIVGVAAVLVVTLQGNTASRFRRWGLATLTMRDLSTVNQVFNAFALDPQRVIGRRWRTGQTSTSTPLSEKLTEVLMRRAWTRSLHFAPLLVLVLVCTRIVGGDQTVDPLNAIGWGVAAALLPMLVAGVNILCLTTDRSAQNLTYLTPGWPQPSELNHAIAKFVVYGAMVDATIITVSFLAMVPFSVNPQFWLIGIASGLSASFIAIALTLHRYLPENPSSAIFNAAGSVICIAPVISLLYLVNRKLGIEPVVFGLIVTTALIAIYRVWRFERGEWAIPVGLRYRPASA